MSIASPGWTKGDDNTRFYKPQIYFDYKTFWGVKWPDIFIIGAIKQLLEQYQPIGFAA